MLLALSLPLLAPVSAPPAVAATAADMAAAVPPLEEINATTTQVAFGLRRPTAIAAPDDGTDRLFITEKRGTVRVYHPDTGLGQTPIIDVTASVDESGNERGCSASPSPPTSRRARTCTWPTPPCPTAP
ncbi:hypothetical protein ACFQQB_33695 [Nonomuraea rubra]|uniref:hypothetical protein n=1 Tax=Nonomuraea rubra TaxID=46180 RepID=UPI00360D3DB6